MLSDEQGGLTRLTSRTCERCDGNHMSNTGESFSAPCPSLLSRLVQATLLVEMVMKDSVDSSSATALTELSLLERDISKLASDLHEDRCQGAEVNCSVLGLCVRSVAQLP